MPGHVQCCWKPVAGWLAAEMPLVKVSLRFGFWTGWRSAKHAELQKPISTPEMMQATEIAREYGLNLIE
jgi:putative pyruvate formate lyase activating enzyme